MKEDALGYIQSSINDPEGKFSLFAEPTVICYGNEEDPHLILAIGAVTNNTGQFAENRYTIIDIDATESEIAKVADDLEKAVKSLTILPQITDSIELEADKTENGTILKGNVKLSPSQVINDLRRPNILASTPEGLFSYVGLRYDEDEGVLTFMVNDKEASFKIADEYVVNGEYKHEDESIHLYKKSGEEIVISCTDLLDEWVVEGENTKSPIVLKKEAVVYGTTAETSSTHALPWQDVLSADVRLSNSQFNILKKTEDERSLEVEGVASNIAYFSNGKQITVKEALDELSTNKLSSDSNNLLYKKLDGFFASAKLKYVGNENALYFTTSNIDGKEHEEKIQLNRVELFKDVNYDPTTESLKITYIDNLGSVQICSVPIGSMLRDWEWQVQSEGHTIALNKERNISGDDILTADAKISTIQDNILQDVDHMLYVKGTANNIKYNATLTVEGVIDTIKESLAESKETEKVLDTKIDTVEAALRNDLRNVESTLNTKIDNVETSLNTKIDGVKSELDNKIDNVNSNLTERADNADAKIKNLEDTKLNSIENKKAADGTVDNSIEISTKADKLAPQISVRLSQNESNIIRTTSDGVEAEVGLGYNPATNVLTFTTSSVNGNKSIEYQLNTTSFVDDIKYDNVTEEIVIKYHSAGGEAQEVRVPVRDIINEIDFTNTSTVKFTREVSPSRGSDIVSANVVISPSLDNALSNINGLFVSKSYFDDKITANANEIANTKSDLAAETTRAKAAETANSSAISAETVRAEAKENEIASNLANEIVRAQDKENALKAETVRIETRIATEETRAISEETAINTKIANIDDDIALLNTKSAELGSKIDNEVARAKDAENTLQANIATVASDLATETARAISEETAINAKIASIDGNIASLNSTANDLGNKIDNEVTRAKAAENTLQANVTAVASDLSTETARAQAAEATLTTSVDGIQSRTTALEDGLNSAKNDLSNEILRSQNKDTEISEKLDSAIEKLNNEVSRATAKDESLTNGLNAEIARAIAKEGELEASFNSTFGSFTNTINNEVSRAQAAENAISLNLEAEKNRAATAEQEIKDSLANEVTKLENADSRLESSLDDAKSQMAELRASTDISYEDTTTVTLAKDSNNVVRANAKVANANENIISLDSTLTGLYARVDLAYNAATNVLTLTTTNDTTEIKLNSASVLQSAQLDNEHNELVLTFQLTDGSISTTRIPLGTLFNTWKAENQAANSAIELTKIDANPNTGVQYDVLKARVLVSASDKNMLKIDGNALFVDNTQVTAATEDLSTLKSEVKKIETAFIGLPLDDGGGNYAYSTDKPFISSGNSWTNAIEILADNLEDATNLLKSRHYVRLITDGETIKHTDSQFVTDNPTMVNALTDDTTAENNGYGNVSFMLDTTVEGNVWLSADVKIIECGLYEGEYRD
jgi:predicted  nucleic acid-binding Zn-ribbon protein